MPIYPHRDYSSMPIHPNRDYSSMSIYHPYPNRDCSSIGYMTPNFCFANIGVASTWRSSFLGVR